MLYIGHAYKKRLYLSNPPPDDITKRTRITRYIPPAPLECMPVILPDPVPERCPTPPPCLPEPKVEVEIDPIDVIAVDFDDEDERPKCPSSRSSRGSRSKCSSARSTTREKEVYIERERFVPVPVPVPVPVRCEPRYHTFRYVDAPPRIPSPPRIPERKMITDDETLRITIEDRHNSREYYQR